MHVLGLPPPYLDKKSKYKLIVFLIQIWRGWPKTCTMKGQMLEKYFQQFSANQQWAGVDLGFSRGGGEDFQKKLKILSTFF